MKSIIAKLGISLVILSLLSTLIVESQAQGYNYKIKVGIIIIPHPNGDGISEDCIHGPGLCRGVLIAPGGGEK